MTHIWSDKSIKVYLIIIFKSHIKNTANRFFFSMKDNACKINITHKSTNKVISYIIINLCIYQMLSSEEHDYEIPQM